jgi:predicted dehydrogenase
MNNPKPLPVRSASTRREFLKNTGRVAAAGALVGTMVPAVHAAEDNTIQVVLIGCGGRGTGAASDCLSVKNGPIKLVGMADVFSKKLEGRYQNLKEQFGKRVDVPEDRRFVSFDGYKQAMDLLKPGDVAILGTPPAFRWPHLTYAIEKGINVFMEKPVTVDGPSTRRMFALGEQAKAKNLKVGVGLMCRHCVARQDLFKRIQDGAIGDIICQRAYRMHAPIASSASPPRPANDKNELLWQIENFHSFLWASGGAFSDFYIHNIDETCWMKNAWPVKAQATGGRHYRDNTVDQNFDSYSVEYTYGDGAKFFLYGRCMTGCHDEFASYAHGSKGLAVISTSGHSPAKCRIYEGQNMDKSKLIWQAARPEPKPYQVEWNDLIAAIREDKPYNEVQRGAEASMVTSLGRIAAHTGQEWTYEDALNSPYELAPEVDKLTMESSAPILANAQGKYPVPMPGLNKDREYSDPNRNPAVSS